MAEYTVYIDEAGDLGVQRGTRWFVLCGVVVKKTDEKAIRENMSQIRTKLNINEIHMRKITDFQKRAFIVRELNQLQFTYMNVIVDTNKFDQGKIPTPVIAYNFVCKYLLQRASWLLSSYGTRADIVLSSRGTSRDGELIQYIQNKLIPFPANQIHNDVFDKITAKSAGMWDLLQLADVCATTTFWKYEINGFGFSVPCFSYMLINHLYTKDSKVDGYGIKFFVDEMKPNENELLMTRICGYNKKEPSA